MDFDELHQQNIAMEERFSELQQQVYFCLNNYDYHHKNNELNILQKHLDILEKVQATCRSFICQVEEVGGVNGALAKARRMVDNVDALILKMGIIKNGETEETTNSKESIKDNNSEKSNR